jgi:hypothetical protein
MQAGTAMPGAAGRAPIILPGETVALDVELSSGTWEVACHLTDNEGGASFDHYDRGMKTALTVE